MIPIVFINCKEQPFIDQILAGDKRYETRNRNTLGSLIGQRVFLAETGHGRRPFVRAVCTISDMWYVCSREAWDWYKPNTCIKDGSKYDWQENSKTKWLYTLCHVSPVAPFYAPEGVRHGRVWMEYDA